MSASDWLLYAVAALAALGFVSLVYRTRETAVPGRILPVLLRAGVFAVLLLLLWDPELPLGGEDAGVGRRWVLLDGTLSMTAAPQTAAPQTATPQTATPWDRAREAARAAARDGAVIYLFGDGLRPVPPESLPAVRAEALQSRILPFLAAAAESGAGAVTVISDMRLTDGEGLVNAVAALPIAVRFEPVAPPLGNAAVVDVTAPRAAGADGTLEVGVTLQAEGLAPGDTMTVELLESGGEAGRARLLAPSAGGLARAAFRVAAPRAGGLVRYDVAVRAAGDVFPDDDVRSVYVSVASEEGGVALVSFRPDWEPRFLLPVLGTATGLPTRGFLLAGSGYVTMGAAPEEVGRRVTESEVRSALARADIAVLHALGEAAPSWAVELARQAARVIAFPADGAGAQALGLDVRPGGPGEWYVAAELPPSPLAAALAGTPTDALPPLIELIAVRDTGAVAGALRAQRGRHGPAEPVLVLQTAGGGRRVVAAARGFWRWSFRPGEPREVYRKLWAAAAGWLLQGEAVAAGAIVRPEPRVVPRAERLRWVAAPSDLDALRLRILAGDSAVTDTTLALRGAGTFTTPPLPPGHYRYVASSPRRPATLLADGPITVERFSGEMIVPPVSARADTVRGGTQRGGERGRRRLHSHPAPYLLAILLLCADWIVRRRKGLR
ncbi:MAG: hypothetical protein HY704_09175 [Gemmatimonadetes bacterium]|nr:hypothetical protein [Gemmatimonadota bacterium]